MTSWARRRVLNSWHVLERDRGRGRHGATGCMGDFSSATAGSAPAGSAAMGWKRRNSEPQRGKDGGQGAGDLGWCFPVATQRHNETRVHPRTREIIVTERGAFSRPARAVENWAPAAAGRTVKSARRAFGGWNASYTVVESRLFGEQRRLASQLAWRRDLGARRQLARLLFTAPRSARRLGSRATSGRRTLRPQRGKDSRQGAVVLA